MPSSQLRDAKFNHTLPFQTHFAVYSCCDGLLAPSELPEWWGWAKWVEFSFKGEDSENWSNVSGDEMKNESSVTAARQVRGLCVQHTVFINWVPWAPGPWDWSMTSFCLQDVVKKVKPSPYYLHVGLGFLLRFWYTKHSPKRCLSGYFTHITSCQYYKNSWQTRSAKGKPPSSVLVSKIGFHVFVWVNICWASFSKTSASSEKFIFLAKTD